MRRFIIVILVGIILASCKNKPLDITKNTQKLPSINEENKKIEKERKNIIENKTNNDNVEPSSEDIKDLETLKKNDDEIIDNKEYDFGLSPSRNHMPPEIPKSMQEMFKKYGAYYLGDTTNKEIYLTFDEGYENGYTSQILDILKKKNVKAAFFVTRPYINQNKELIKRMVEEGHIVGNHSSTHPSMPSKATDFNKFKKEFEDTELAFKEVTGQEMPKFFRPPMGKFSERSLYYTQKLGYKTIFWSFAHKDWLVNEQPPVEVTIERIMNRYHNGEIMLLHAVSKSNTEALETIIDKLRELGYEFKPLTELK
ncbi:delta-lactam-biosynthetic de-N-acetylase [Caloramator sp. CAR-1]|uniref:delta-lactam-biosynthetic de-N-acetylase n=1 Tax=Caloramator sp. CAR-1 TaxID=3062777 RepID=UPI0026E35442|nr:delta-lactam-biosynthetic de-N-acetylase [Caloramator sp. CAR-1]MDO6354055.1 delta-lactam-biosynthetic de-N-acetylase [Caloramator sp. CAR-1]